MASANKPKKRSGRKYPGEIIKVNNPLIAVMCISKDKDKNDLKAKKQDYIKSLFSWNGLLGFNVIYRSVDDTSTDSNDEKQDISNNDQISHESNYIKEKLEFNDINKIKYQLSWTSNEITSFLKEVNEVYSDEKNKHDGLFYIITSYTVENGSYMHLFDSFGKTVNIEGIFTTFEKDENDKRPMVFIIDRYFEVDSKEIALKINYDRQRDQNRPFEGFQKYVDEPTKYGVFYQYYSHFRALAVPNASINGGVCVSALKGICSDKTVQNGERYIQLILIGMSKRIGPKGGINAIPVREDGMDYDVRRRYYLCPP